MKKILLLLVLISLNLSAQEEKTDTVKIHLYNFNQTDLMLYNGLEINIPEYNDIIPPVDPGNARLFSGYLLSSSGKNEFFGAMQPHILDNYHQFYVENSGFSIYKFIFGMTQIGAVGYLAYKHIKKYGLR